MKLDGKALENRIISAREILNFGHFSRKHDRVSVRKGDRSTDRRTDQRTDTPSHRDARTKNPVAVHFHPRFVPYLTMNLPDDLQDFPLYPRRSTL